MATLTYPGVYIEEIGSGQHSITGVATSIAAFIGYTNVGPVDEAVMVESWAQYESLFGGMIPGVYLGYAVYQFFLNGGSQAYVVRLCDQTVGQAAVAHALIGGLQISANNPGAWGNNVAVAITGVNAVNSTFNLQVYELTGSGSLNLVESYSNLSIFPTSATYAVTVVNSDSTYIAFTPVVVPPAPPPVLTVPTSSGVYTVNGKVTAGAVAKGDSLTQTSGALPAVMGTVLIAPTATTPMTIQITSGTVVTTNPTDTWTNGANTFTQSGPPMQMPMALISGSITGGPFTAGETVTQQQSGANPPTAICVGSTSATPLAGLATPGLLLLQDMTGKPANSFTQWHGATSNAVCTPINAPVPTFAMPLAVAGGFSAGADESAPLKPDDATTSANFLTHLLNTADAGTGTDTSTMPLIQVGGPPYAGTGPLKFANAEVASIHVACPTLDVTVENKFGAAIPVGAVCQITPTLVNTGEAKWLATSAASRGVMLHTTAGDIPLTAALPSMQRTAMGPLTITMPASGMIVTGRMQIAGVGAFGEAFTLQLSPDTTSTGSCATTLSSTGPISAPAAGATGTIQVSTPAGTGNWTTYLFPQQWATVTPASGSGNGAATYTIAANLGSARQTN